MRVVFILFLMLAACGPWVTSGETASQLSSGVCARMKACSEGHSFAAADCVATLEGHYREKLAQNRTERLRLSTFEKCLADVYKEKCSAINLRKLPESCQLFIPQ